MTTSALTAPLSPATYATDPTPLGDEAWLRVTLDRIFADLRDTWEPELCRTCGAVLPASCREGGRFVKRHGGQS